MANAPQNSGVQPSNAHRIGEHLYRKWRKPNGDFWYEVYFVVRKTRTHVDVKGFMEDELRGRQVGLSLSQVGYLAKKFVVYLALAHRQSAPRLKEAMHRQGGYILHLDGTGEGGGPRLMSSLDSLSQIVLGNVKVPSEKTEQIVPFLQEIKARYGVPVAAVHDMGSGILAAIKEVFAGVPDFVCHFHFLRDVGKDLLESDYDAIRKRLRQHGLTEKLLYHARRLKAVIGEQPGLVENFYHQLQGNCLPTEKLELFPLLCGYSLILWALEGKTQGEGYGFPFDRPHVQFAKRLRALGQLLEQIKNVHLRGHWQWADNKPLYKIACQLKRVSADEGLQRMLTAIDLKIEVFDRLRSAMRIAAGLPHRRRADRAGQPMAGERQGHQPIDDGIHPALALRRAPREGMARSAVVPVALEGLCQPLFLGGLHAHWPVELSRKDEVGAGAPPSRAQCSASEMTQLKEGAGRAPNWVGSLLPGDDLESGIAYGSRRYYLWPMTTMTLKLPETLRRGVEEEARRRGVPRSVLVRECVEAMLRRKQRRKLPTCLDLVGDLVGSQPGPRDASVNRRYLEEAVLAQHGRARKNSR